MSHFAANLDATDLLFYPHPPTSSSPLHLPYDDLVHLRADSELLRRTAKPRSDPHSFFEYGPPVHPPPPPPALLSPQRAGEVLGHGYFGNFAVSHRDVDDRRQVYQFQLPAKPVRAQAEESCSAAKARARAQTGAASVRGGLARSRDYGGTGFFLPRIVNNGDGGRNSGMQGGGGEKQKQQPVRGLPSGRQAALRQQYPSERVLPQDWSY